MAYMFTSHNPLTIRVEVRRPAGVVNVPIVNPLTLDVLPVVIVVCVPVVTLELSVPVTGVPFVAVPPAVSKNSVRPPDTPANPCGPVGPVTFEAAPVGPV